MNLCETQTKCLAVVRGKSAITVKTALCDLIRFADLTFVSQPKMCEPVFADNVLIQILNRPLKTCCEAAAIVELADNAKDAILKVRKIHPPAHVIIVSPLHEIYHDLVKYVDMLPEIDITLPKLPVLVEQTAEHEDRA